jgi:ubiquinol-cytochrome c reductase cytochrome c1 subunit
MTLASRFLLLALAATASTSAAYAAGDAKPPRQMHWSFDGMLGTVDKQSAQRGLQVYKEVCSACHGLKRIAFRNLADIGFTEAEIKALAASYQIKDGPNDDGDMYERPGIASDYFPSPYTNEQQARATHNGAYPPDLSLIIKARHDGANYLYSLLTGYEAPPADVQLGAGQYYNPYMPGHKIAMAQPMADGQVSYEDGTQASLDQMSRDVVNFLQWAAEPEMEHRKQTGLKVLFFLAVFTGFMFAAYRKLWRNIH